MSRTFQCALLECWSLVRSIVQLLSSFNLTDHSSWMLPVFTRKDCHNWHTLFLLLSVWVRLLSKWWVCMISHKFSRYAPHHVMNDEIPHPSILFTSFWSVTNNCRWSYKPICILLHFVEVMPSIGHLFWSFIINTGHWKCIMF